MFIRGRHWSPSWARRIQSINSIPSLKPILILSYHLRLEIQSSFFPPGFLTKIQRMHPNLRHVLKFRNRPHFTVGKSYILAHIFYQLCSCVFSIFTVPPPPIYGSPLHPQIRGLYGKWVLLKPQGKALPWIAERGYGFRVRDGCEYVASAVSDRRQGVIFHVGSCMQFWILLTIFVVPDNWIWYCTSDDVGLRFCCRVHLEIYVWHKICFFTSVTLLFWYRAVTYSSRRWRTSLG